MQESHVLREIFDAYSQDVLTQPERVDSALVPGTGAEFADVQKPGRMEAAWWLKANWDSWEWRRGKVTTSRAKSHRSSWESMSASNDSWWLLKWHHGLVIPSTKGVDSRPTVGRTWACFHTACLENNLTSILPSYCQQSPTDMRGGVHLKEWFEGEWLKRIFQTFIPHKKDKTQENMKISVQ